VPQPCRALRGERRGRESSAPGGASSEGGGAGAGGGRAVRDARPLRLPLLLLPGRRGPHRCPPSPPPPALAPQPTAGELLWVSQQQQPRSHPLWPRRRHSSSTASASPSGSGAHPIRARSHRQPGLPAPHEAPLPLLLVSSRTRSSLQRQPPPPPPRDLRRTGRRALLLPGCCCCCLPPAAAARHVAAHAGRLPRPAPRARQRAARRRHRCRNRSRRPLPWFRGRRQRRGAVPGQQQLAPLLQSPCAAGCCRRPCCRRAPHSRRSPAAGGAP